NAQRTGKTERHLGNAGEVFDIAGQQRRIEGTGSDVVERNTGLAGNKGASRLCHFRRVIVVRITRQFVVVVVAHACPRKTRCEGKGYPKRIDRSTTIHSRERKTESDRER